MLFADDATSTVGWAGVIMAIVTSAAGVFAGLFAYLGKRSEQLTATERVEMRRDVDELKRTNTALTLSVTECHAERDDIKKKFSDLDTTCRDQWREINELKSAVCRLPSVPAAGS